MINYTKIIPSFICVRNQLNFEFFTVPHNTHMLDKIAKLQICNTIEKMMRLCAIGA